MYILLCALDWRGKFIIEKLDKNWTFATQIKLLDIVTSVVIRIFGQKRSISTVWNSELLEPLGKYHAGMLIVDSGGI